MSKVVLKSEDISKMYRLGLVSTKTLSHDLNRWFSRVRGKEDPYLKIGESNDRSKKGESEYVWALKDINFEITQGESVGIVGRNGAGKSTLLKILSRVTQPTTGSLKVKGRIASLLEVGTGFHPELTGRENIFLNGAILGMRKKEITRKLDEIIDFSGVERYIDTPVKRYSSGMYVRLAFAVAAHLESEIMIVDEVLAVGDAEFQKKCLGKMGQVSSNEGRTVLFVSHNMAAVQSLCSKGMLMQFGQIKEFGNTNEVIRSYLKSGSVSDGSLIRDLTNAHRSAGRGNIIKKIWIENASGEIVNHLMMGESFSVKFYFESPDPIANLLVGFGIENELGYRVSSLNNEIAGTGAYSLLNSGTATLKIDDPNFIEGDYFISVSIVSNQNEWIDYIEQAYSFNIQEADVYGTGKLISSSQGIVYMKGNVLVH
jgi:lipopolysaccharide transport system ATP-binding protein